MLDQLPRACKAVGTDGIDVERYTLQLDLALTELGDALPTLRSQIEASVLHAFGTRNLGELRRQVALNYEDHRLELGSYELRAFVDRALKDDVDDEAWIDGVAGLVVGKRLGRLERHAGRPFSASRYEAWPKSWPGALR